MLQSGGKYTSELIKKIAQIKCERWCICKRQINT